MGKHWVHIQGGDTTTIEYVRDDTYFAYFMVGEGWNSEQNDFTRRTSRYRLENPLTFRTTATQYTEYSVWLSYAHVEPVPEDEFPSIP